MSLLSLLLYAGIFYKAFCYDTANDLCLTVGCKASAEQINNSLDLTVDPCDNFYQFACGNAIKNMVIPDDDLYVNTFNRIKNKVFEQINAVLSTPIEDSDITPNKLVKNYYRACINEDSIEKHGLTVIKELLQKLGGWPVLEQDDWNSNNFSWVKLMSRFRNLGIEATYFVEMTVDPDPNDSIVRIVELDQAVLALSRELLLDKPKMQVYLELMIDVAVELGADRKKAEIELDQALQFYIKLAKYSLPLEDRRNTSALLNYMKVSEIQEKFPNTPWLEFINSLLPVDIQLTSNHTVLMIAQSYFISFDKLIAETPKRVQANYGIWRAIISIVNYLPKKIVELSQNASTDIFGLIHQPPREKLCTTDVHSRLPLLVSSLYIHKFFDEEAKTNADEIVRFIQQTFIHTLKNINWMDESTKEKALSKAKKMENLVGYPNELLNDTLLEEHYADLKINPEEYLRSSLNITIHETNFKYRLLFQPVSEKDWLENANAAEVGANYDHLKNSIFLQAGILQGVFFNKSRPRYLNFGAIGSVIGHEITHGFDDVGRLWGENGSLVNWWTPETERKFLNKTACIINQYDNYHVKQINKTLNGRRTQGENIADNAGVKQAYLAYKMWIAENGVEPKLPDLPYSPEQLFWISAAMNWCANYRTPYLEIVVNSYVHSPNEFRVLGSFSNSQEFAKDFSCPTGTAMNPTQKCSVW